MTVLEVIQRSTEFLQRKGVDSPRLQSELLLAHVLGVPRMRLYLDFEKPLSAEQLERVRHLVKRRGQREPLQQILGVTSFCGLEFVIDRHVLVPRPETELLAEMAWSFLSGLNESSGGELDLLDVGTGSGCIAVTLAVKIPSARILAVDVSSEALVVASRNAEQHKVLERITFASADAFGAVPEDRRFHLVVSNPPYIPTAELSALQPEVRDYEPRQALDGGEDGLEFYRRLAAQGSMWLRSDGRLMAEFGDGQAPAITRLFEAQKWVVEKIAEDYTHRPRILIAKPNAD